MTDLSRRGIENILNLLDRLLLLLVSLSESLENTLFTLFQSSGFSVFLANFDDLLLDDLVLLLSDLGPFLGSECFAPLPNSIIGVLDHLALLFDLLQVSSILLLLDL